MSDIFDSAFNVGKTFVTNVAANSKIVLSPPQNHLNAAQRVFSSSGEGGNAGYTLPKLKYSFIVEFILSEYAKDFIKNQLLDTHSRFDIYNVSCFVRDVNLPSAAFEIDEMNQYNRTRYQTGKITYKPSTIAFYDTVDSAALLLFDAYRKYYYGDFFNKSPISFRNDVLSNPIQFEKTGGNWGRSVMNNGNYDSQYFFQQINIYEIDNETYTAHNMFNVFVEDVTPETKTMESDGEAGVLTATLRYEGMGNLNPQGYASIAVPTMEIGALITDTSGLGKAGFFKYFGELDDRSMGLSTIGKIIRAGTAGHDIIASVGSILRGDISPDVIRNIGSAVKRGAAAIGLGSVVSSANEKFGLGNILGDF